MMLRPIGVCTWIFGNTSLSNIVHALASLGYNGVELLGDPKRYPARETRKLLSGEGLSVFSLTPLNVDLAHPNPTIRRRALNYYLRLLDYAAEVGAKVVSCHGKVGRVRPVSFQFEEEKLLAESVAALAERAEKNNIKLALEPLNRYESHLVNTAAQALALIETVNSEAVGVLLDTYHMNIEEADLCYAIHNAAERLFLFHVADSNRRAPGAGHIDFERVFSALDGVFYSGPVIIECTAPGPDPFSAEKGPGWQKIIWDEVKAAISFFRTFYRM